MDLSTDNRNLQEQINEQSSDNKERSANVQDLSDILDLSNLNLDNEETWLYEVEGALGGDNGQNTHNWLYKEPIFTSDSSKFGESTLKSSKIIDTRTFTRPKKKLARPSINDIERMYNSGSDGNEMTSSIEERSSKTKVPQTVQEEQEQNPSNVPKPLHFDLSQPTSMHTFDSFIFNNASIESFQNMSPPSLVNSLCSSTFANLMDSSFIKNDPVLREIRDKDFTETALLQDMEAPMFQSITESCSSLNSDTPESFLKKVTRDVQRNQTLVNNNSTLKECFNESEGNDTLANATFQVLDASEDSNPDVKDTTFSVELPPRYAKSFNTQSSTENLNGTYRRIPKHNGTFSKSDLKNNRRSLNLSYESAKDNFNVLDRNITTSIENDMNNSNKDSSEKVNTTRTRYSRKTMILHSDSIEELKRLSSSDRDMDLNRLSYCQEKKEDQVNVTYKDKIASELNRTVDIKSSSLGSADSLDRMSSLSSSSKGSNKVLSMEDVQAIVEMQERSLSQVMSTPKVASRTQNMWEHNFISPISANDKDTLSDSELSDEYKSVKSQASSKITLDSWKRPSAKTLGFISDNKNVKSKPNGRSAYTITGPKPIQALPSNIRGSYSNLSNLRTSPSALGGSQQNLHKTANQMVQPPTSTNLKNMGTKLKGSYTSLRPISANLPVVPPVGSTLNSTHTVTRPSPGSRNGVLNSTRTVNAAKLQAPSAPRPAHFQEIGDNVFVNPQPVRMSGLPRPTGIPRPASRIPAPRSANIRPMMTKSKNY